MEEMGEEANISEGREGREVMRREEGDLVYVL
jgi:hypothetical protein